MSAILVKMPPNSQCRSAQRFADRKADEARPRIIARNKEQNHQHHQEFNADKHHADTHARAHRDPVNGIRLALQAGECSAGVSKCVHADAVPRYTITSANAEHAERQNDDHPERCVVQEDAKIQNNNGRNKDPEQEEEFTLLDEVGLAGLPDQLGYLGH